MKHKRTWEILIWVLALLPLAATLVLYSRLPQQVPIHWNMQGEVDGYGSRSALLWMGLIAPGCSLMMLVLPRLDPRRDNYPRFAKGYLAMRVLLAAFFGGVQIVSLYAAFDATALPVGRLITAGTGLVICVIGNFMPKFKHNYFCGIKTPWALASEENWRRTHRLAGLVWFWGGLAILVLGLVLPEAAAAAVLIGVMIPVGLLPVVYSGWLWYTGRAR